MIQFELVDFSDDLRGLGGFHGALRQVTALIVEQAMRISSPGDSLHQNPIPVSHKYQILQKSIEIGAKSLS